MSFIAQYKMEAVVKGLLEIHPLPLGYLELFEPILLSRKSFSKLNGILEVGRKCEEIDNVELTKGIPFWTVFQRGKTVLEKKFLRYHSDMELTDAEEKAVMRLISVFKNDLPVKLEEVKRIQTVNEVTMNITIAHNFLGPLNGECILNDSHKAEMSNFKKSCQTSSCQGCEVINTPSGSGLDGLCMGHGNAWYGEPDMIVSVPVVCGKDDDTSNSGEESPETGTSVEGAPDCKKVYITFGQTISTAITFSYVQKKRHRSKNAMVPTLNVWSGGFYVLLHDCESDILLYSGRIMWDAHAIVYLWVILHHRLFLDFLPPRDGDYSCGYLESAQQQNCGLPFVDNLLYCKHINNPNFRVESVMEQKMNDEPYIALTIQCIKS